MTIEDNAPAGAAGGDDLRSALTAAMTEHAEPSVSIPADKPAPDRTRDEAGRFAAKAASPADSQPAATPSVPTPEAPGTAPAATRKAPSAWKTDHHEAFLRLDPAIQDYILERENEVKRGFDERAPKVKAAEDWDRILSPYAALMQQRGLSPTQAVEKLMQAQAMLDQNPEEGIRQLAQLYRVNLGAQPQQPGAGQPQQHPVLDKVSRLEKTVETLQQERQQAQHEALKASVDTFKAANPHFDSVRPLMAQLMNAGQADTLQDAYDKAIWLDPTTRDKLIAERSAPPPAAAEAERARADQATAERARKAASSVRGAPSGTPSAPSNPKASLRDDIVAAMQS